MKAKENVPQIDYDVVFWDGKPYDKKKGTGHWKVTHIGEIDGRQRGMLRSKGNAYTLFEGDAVIAHMVKGEVLSFTAMEREMALATFDIEQDKTPALPAGVSKSKKEKVDA